MTLGWAAIDWLAHAFATLAIASTFAGFGLLAGQLYLIGMHLALRREGLAHERAALARPLPPDRDLPHVVVQVPVYNEGAIVERAIASVARLDWPRDKLHIQICDDSTDETTNLARAAAERVAASGIDIVVLRRPDLAGYKAGNLRAAMAQSDHAYFAIFDVDYIPPPDFLRRCMAVMLADPELGFVQARPEFLNLNENALTRSQAMLLDAHYAVEQATRSWAGHPLPFNGTCGIWRRSAIEAGGGWQGETLAEDMELSYRAWFQGRRGIFVTSVSAPGELPVDRKAWLSQQRRWTKGSGEVMRQMLPAIWRDPRLSPAARIGALLNLAMWWGTPVLLTSIVASAIAALLKPSLTPLVGAFLTLLIVTLVAILFLRWRIGNRFVRGDSVPFGRFVLEFFSALGFQFYLMWASIRAHLDALLGRKSEFERTPKRGTIESAP